MGGQKLEVTFEGKSTTVESDSAEERMEAIKKFAEENGLHRFMAKDEKGDKIQPQEIHKVKKIKLLRTEVAGTFPA